MIPDLLFGDLPAEFLLRTPEYSGVDRADRQRNDGVATGRLQNGVKTVSKWNGVGTSMRKPLRLQSNGTSASSQGRPFSGYGNLTQPHSIQNGIGPHMFGQTGTQPSISTSGLHVKSYYTSSEEEECGGREGGASRMVSTHTHTHTHTHTNTHTHTHTVAVFEEVSPEGSRRPQQTAKTAVSLHRVCHRSTLLSSEVHAAG